MSEREPWPDVLLQTGDLHLADWAHGFLRSVSFIRGVSTSAKVRTKLRTNWAAAPARSPSASTSALPRGGPLQAALAASVTFCQWNRSMHFQFESQIIRFTATIHVVELRVWYCRSRWQRRCGRNTVHISTPTTGP